MGCLAYGVQSVPVLLILYTARLRIALEATARRGLLLRLQIHLLLLRVPAVRSLHRRD